MRVVERDDALRACYDKRMRSYTIRPSVGDVIIATDRVTVGAQCVVHDERIMLIKLSDVTRSTVVIVIGTSHHDNGTVLCAFLLMPDGTIAINHMFGAVCRWSRVDDTSRT